MCNRKIAIILSDLNNIRVKNELKKQNIFSLGCYTNIDVYNTGQLLEFISLIDSCIPHNYQLSKDIEELCNRLFNVIYSNERYRDELEITMNNNIQSISRDLIVATEIYDNYNQADNLMDYIRNNYNTLITNITNLYDSNINTLDSLYYVIDGINKIDHNNYE